MHGRHEGLFSFPVTEIRRRYESSELASSGWLPLYEIERRGWDPSLAFRKIGRAEDTGGLYGNLNSAGVEFYLTNPEAFDVSAFDGWNLTQGDFIVEARLNADAQQNLDTFLWAEHYDVDTYE